MSRAQFDLVSEKIVLLFRMEKVRGSLDDYLDEYNTFSQKDMNLVFFQDAIEHISR